MTERIRYLVFSFGAHGIIVVLAWPFFATCGAARRTLSRNAFFIFARSRKHYDLMGTRMASTRQRRACLAIAAIWGIGALSNRMDHQLFVLLIVVIYSITDLGEAHRYAAALSGLDGLRLGSDHITVEEHHPSAQTPRAVS